VVQSIAAVVACRVVSLATNWRHRRQWQLTSRRAIDQRRSRCEYVGSRSVWTMGKQYENE